MIKNKYSLGFVMKFHFLLVGLITCQAGNNCYAFPLKIGIGQFYNDTFSFGENRDKILSMMDRAKAAGCDIVVFHENALRDPDNSVSKDCFDAAIRSIKEKAASTRLFVVCGVVYRESDNPEQYQARALVVNSSGVLESFYRKYVEMPKVFHVKGIACDALICADRYSLEMADVFCLVQGVKVIFDISGGHGGDEGYPGLRWIRYRPWAQRTNAFVIVANPPHYTTDFMGNQPWGGHSAIINPDGSFVAKSAFEKDTLIVKTINSADATRLMAIERRDNIVFKPLWDMGESILKGSIPDTSPCSQYISPVTTVKVAAVQMACSRSVSKNIEIILRYITEAAKNGTDLVVFPELAVTGALPEDIEKVTRVELSAALKRVTGKA